MTKTSEHIYSTPRPFAISVSDPVLEDIAARLAEYPWIDTPDVPGWSAGTSLAYMRDLVRYWLDSYDWRAAESKLNRFPNYQATIDGLSLHFVHVKGSGSNPKPLLLCHGWPGSFFEFDALVEKLTSPEKFGGSQGDSFDVIIPSMPGFGFSGRPQYPMGPRAMAELYETLMTKVLGYQSYIAQGGDWGAHVAGWLGYLYPNSCKAVHLNLIGVHNPEMKVTHTGAERAWEEKALASFDREGAYFLLQATKPQTLTFAMTDSPVGIAAWIIEKFAGWADLPSNPDGSPNLRARFTEDQLLTNIMIYLVTKSSSTSTWIYYGCAREQPANIEPGRGIPAQMESGTRLEVPTGVAAFPDPVFAPPPRSLAERGYNIVHWTDMPRGGHFAAMEEPDLFVNDVRAFAKLIQF